MSEVWLIWVAIFFLFGICVGFPVVCAIISLSLNKTSLFQSLCGTQKKVINEKS